MTTREPFAELDIKKAASGFYKDYSVPMIVSPGVVYETV